MRVVCVWCVRGVCVVCVWCVCVVCVWCVCGVHVWCVCALTTDGPAAVNCDVVMALCWSGRFPGATKYISPINCSASLGYTLPHQGKGGGREGREGWGEEEGRKVNGSASGYHCPRRCVWQIKGAVPAFLLQDGEKGLHLLP